MRVEVVWLEFGMVICCFWLSSGTVFVRRVYEHFLVADFGV